jgi:hypothetical protein
MNSMQKTSIISIIILSTLAILVIFPEEALAGKFDIQAGARAANDRIMQTLKDHWGKMLLVASVIALFFGKGD